MFLLSDRRYMGCYNDSESDPDLPVYIAGPGNDTKLTAVQCITRCAQLGHLYAGNISHLLKMRILGASHLQFWRGYVFGGSHPRSRYSVFFYFPGGPEKQGLRYFYQHA